jgi:hypothetical protein
MYRIGGRYCNWASTDIGHPVPVTPDIPVRPRDLFTAVDSLDPFFYPLDPLTPSASRAVDVLADGKGRQEVDHTEENEKLNSTSSTRMLVVADDREGRFIWLVNSGRKQGAEGFREAHRVNTQAFGYLSSLPPTGGNLARPWPLSPPRGFRR